LRPASVEDLEGSDDDEDVEATADERLRDDQAYDEPGAPLMHDCPEPVRDHSPEAPPVGLGGEADAALDLDASEQDGADDKHCRPKGEDRSHVRKRHQHPRDHRPDERAEALDRRRRAVRRDQLLRRPRQRRQQRLQRRPDQRRREPDNAGEREYEDSIVCGRRCRGGGERTGTEERQCEKKALAAKPVAERSGEGCDGRCRQQPDQPRDADRGGTALLVGKDAERDEMRPLRRNRRAPGEFHPPNVVVSKSGSESRDQPTWLNHQLIESVAVLRNNPGPCGETLLVRGCASSDRGDATRACGRHACAGDRHRHASSPELGV